MLVSARIMEDGIKSEPGSLSRGMKMRLGEIILSGTLLFLVVGEGWLLAVGSFSAFATNSPGILAQSYILLAPLSPIVIWGILYTWALKYFTHEASRHFKRARQGIISLTLRTFGSLVSWARTTSLEDAVNTIEILNRPRLMLGMAIISGVLLTYTPYRSDLNPAGILVGADAPLYRDWVEQMLSRPSSEALQYAFVSGGGEGTRPLLLILLYAAASMGGMTAEQIVRSVPLILAPLLVVSSYIFVWSGLDDERLAGLVALFTSFSFNVTVGMWAGYFANWLALVESYLFLALFLKLLRSPSTVKSVALITVSTCIFLTHPWTWAIMALLTTTSVLTSKKLLQNGFITRSIALMITAGLATDVWKGHLFGAQTLGGDLASRFASYGLAELLNAWSNSIDALLVRYDGLLGHSVLLGLALVSVPLLRDSVQFERLLALWVLVGSLVFAFVDSYHQTRLIYDLPVATLASIGLVLIVHAFRRKSLWAWGILLATVLFNANYALNAMIRA